MRELFVREIHGGTAINDYLLSCEVVIVDGVRVDDGILVALDAKTGKEHYRERLKGAFNSSPVAGNDHIYVSNNDGVTFVVKTGTQFEIVNTNNLGERITASPAITGDAMIYRTDSHLYCIGTSPKR